MILSSIGTIDSFDDKLILFYDASNLSSYPGNGTTITDLSPYSNDGVMNGTVYDSSSPKFFKSDGVDDYITLPQNFISWDSGQPFTFIIWFKGTGQGVIIGQSGTPSGYVPALYVDSNNKLRSSFFWHGAASPYDTDLTVTDDVWRQFAVTYNGTAESIYIDGVLLNSVNQPQVNYSSTYNYFLATGTVNFWPSQPSDPYWEGDINTIKVYQRALSATEITTQYNELISRF